MMNMEKCYAMYVTIQMMKFELEGFNMEIIRKGDINEAKRKIKMTKRFECSVCGCIFKADLGEYKCESQYNSTYY